MARYLRLFSTAGNPTQDPTTDRFCPSLPPELWNIIFYYATTYSYCGQSHVHVQPTTSQRELVKLHQFPRQLRMKHSLVLVCKLWHAIASPFLYEAVWVNQPVVARCFLRTLVDSASTGPQAGYGKLVRSLILPGGEMSNGWEGFQITDILNRCPNLHAVYKPSGMSPNFWHGGACTGSCPTCPALGPLTSLTCVFWVCSPSEQAIAVEAFQLSRLLLHAPNLTHLFVSNFGRFPLSLRRPSTNPLTACTTLEYFTRNTALSLHQADMPNLSHIIAGSTTLNIRDPNNGNHSLLSVFGKQLKVIEFPDVIDVGDTAILDIRSIFHHCPNLHTLSYNVMCTVLPSENVVLHSSLSVIAVRITLSGAIDDAAVERCLRMHVKTITGEAFPALNRVEMEFRGGCHRQFYPACFDLGKRFPLQRIDGTTVVWELGGKQPPGPHNAKHTNPYI